MGLWSLYFLGKLYLDFRGFIRIHVLANVLFIALLLLPTPARFENSRWFRASRLGLSALVAFFLLWHDTYLPALGDAISFARDNPLPEKEFVFRFLIGFVHPLELGVLLALLGAAFLLRRRVRLGAVVVLLLLVTSLRGLAGGPVGEVEQHVDAFYRGEARRSVIFESPPDGAPAFDIVILHVCSVGWDDLRAVGLEQDRFFDEFDALLTGFNSVTSYSGPAMLRLLAANHGQRAHGDLYAPDPGERLLFDELRAAGYETYFALNHDGTYAHFAAQAQAFGRTGAPFIPRGLAPQAFNFDGSPIFSDRAALEQWWTLRQQRPQKPAAVYYNTISLHDGAHRAADKTWWKADRTQLYRDRVRALFDDLAAFFRLVEASGRSAVVLFVPEHGLALRGSTVQVAGLRDIPFPRITLVPVGIKWIGGTGGAGETVGAGHAGTPRQRRVISTPTSYFALASLIAEMLRRSGTASRALDDALDRLPATEFLAENQNARVVRIGTATYLSGAERRWSVAPREAPN